MPPLDGTSPSSGFGRLAWLLIRQLIPARLDRGASAFGGHSSRAPLGFQPISLEYIHPPLVLSSSAQTGRAGAKVAHSRARAVEWHSNGPVAEQCGGSVVELEPV